MICSPAISGVIGMMIVATLVTVVLALVAWTVVRNWPGFPLVPTVSTG